MTQESVKLDSANNWIAIQEKDFDASAIKRALLDSYESTVKVGALVEFTGFVRADAVDEDQVQGLFLEHYRGMTEKSIAKIIADAKERWSLDSFAVVHRVGNLAVGDSIVYVAVTASHRKDAFAAAQFLMDFLKNDVPIWKKQLTTASNDWVEQKQTDLQAKNLWE